MSEIIYKEILPKVFVYKNLIPNHKSYYEFLSKVHDNKIQTYIFYEPEQWGHYGQSLTHRAKHEDRLPIVIENQIGAFPEAKEEIAFEAKLIKEFDDAFIAATDHFLEKHNLLEAKKNWIIQPPSFDMYNPTSEEHMLEYLYENNGIKLAMSHHSDYQVEREEMPGNKFVLTVTFYINDDYDGGELRFLNKSIDTPYKPEAGDIVVFPSGNPKYLSEEGRYFHGVGAVKNSRKFFCRSFYVEPYLGSDEWLANQAKYGEEVWAEMEKARIAAGLRKMGEEIKIENPITLEDLGIDPETECGLEEFRKNKNE